MAVRQVIGANPMGGPLPPGVTGYRKRDDGPWEPVYAGERRRSRAVDREWVAKMDARAGHTAPEASGGYPAGLTREELFQRLPGVWRVQRIGDQWYTAGGERIGSSLAGHNPRLWAAYLRGQLGAWLAEHDRGTTAEEATANAEREGTRSPVVVEQERNQRALAEHRRQQAAQSGGSTTDSGEGAPAAPAGGAQFGGYAVPALAVAALALLLGGGGK